MPALRLMGPMGEVADAETTGLWLRLRLSGRSACTSEIKRNIVAERVLGLPSGDAEVQLH